jgi:hypothetical protein
MLKELDPETAAAVDDLMTEADRPWSPPTTEDIVMWGKYRAHKLTYRQLAARDAGYCKWAATQIGGLKGQLCALALALHLGVTE